MNWLIEFCQSHALEGVAVFMVAHLTSSTLGIPGGCTALNLTAGAVFGFARACAVLFPITMLSALLMYGVGSRLGTLPWAKRMQTPTENILSRIRHADVLVLLGLRWSPIVPFNLMNFSCGLLHIRWPVFFLTTLAGIFFDVTVLAGLGAGIKGLM